MTHRIALDRLSIRLRGVAPPVAAAALDGLGEALRQRLARTAVSSLPTSGAVRVSIGGEDLADPGDPAALRDALAARIVAGLGEARRRGGGS